MPISSKPNRPEEDSPESLKDRSTSLDFVIGAAEILLVICLVKGNSAWQGLLSVLFAGVGGGLISRYRRDKEKAFLWVGVLLLLLAATLLLWFTLA